MVSLMRQDKKKQKAKVRRARKEAEARGEEATDGHSQVQRQEPRSIDKMREADETIVPAEDSEVEEDEAMDEFEKILVTTQQKPSKKCFDFLKELVNVIPNTFYYPRRDFPFKKICEYATNKDFTDVMLFHEKAKVLQGVYISHLPKGPTSYWRITRLKLGQDMKGGATCNASHNPELILNGFVTRLGRRLARQFAALFPQRTVTFHNQRDFIFFRHYRYVFKEDGTKCKLQEIGPRFTMKCRYLQHGTFDAKEGEYEFIWRPDSQVSRKKFFAASSVSTSLGIQVILALVFVALVCLE
ncbi:rpf1 [Symbiodinium microadriaticum]|nr:rpf1 [Symbiodinium microadriaticum]